MTGAGAIAAWTGPALVVAVVARVALGGVEAPLFVLAALAAPLLALLAAPRAHGESARLPLAIGVVTAACVLGAGFRALTDLGHVLGFETAPTLGVAVALVLAATVRAGRVDVAVAALGFAVAALLIAVLVLGVMVADPPWTAWGRIASRSAFDLGPRSAWTAEGARAFVPITLTFTEPHRITATTAGVYRVTEHDRGAAVVREWRLAAGDSLMLRPGDSLSIPAGARVRFEAGRRLPGAPASGVAWADRSGAPRARLLSEWVGLVVTLVGGAVAVLRPTQALSRSAAVAGPLVVLVVMSAATCWGVYAVHAAPELSIGTPPGASLALLAPMVTAGLWRSRLLAAVVVALVALLLASAVALRRRLVELADQETRRRAVTTRRDVIWTAAWIALVAVAAAAGLVVDDGWTLLREGMGLAAAVLLGPLLATGDAAGFARARLAGALTGAALFAALTAAAHWPVPLAPGVAQYPALLAAPAGWLVAVLARRETVAAARGR